jgi:hypothetical protein
MPKSPLQNIEITCGLCGATVPYNEDMECIMDDWDITYAQDPCSPGCHVPESELPSKVKMVCEDFQYPEEVKSAHWDRQFRRMFPAEKSQFKKGIKAEEMKSPPVLGSYSSWGWRGF